MKTHRRSLLSAVLMMLIACGCEKKQGFPGFTYIGNDGSESGYVDLRSVQSGADGVTFSFIAQRLNGQYSLVKVFSDCSKQFRRIGGTTYDRDGTVLGEVPAEQKPSPLSTNAMVKLAASSACGTPIIDRSTATDKFDVDEALHALFGNDDSQSHTALWTDIDVPNRSDLSNFRGISNGTVAIAFDGPYRESGVDKHFVFTLTKLAAESYDCHVYLPLLSAAVFRQEGGEWRIESEAKYLMLGAGFGQKPRCQLIQFGRDKYGVLMHYSDTAQGFETEWIVLVASEGSTIRPLLTLTTRQDPNDELCQHAPANDNRCVRYSVEYRFLPASNADYFGLDTTKTTKTQEGNVTSSEVFSFVGDRYVRSGAKQ